MGPVAAGWDPVVGPDTIVALFFFRFAGMRGEKDQ